MDGRVHIYQEFFMSHRFSEESHHVASITSIIIEGKPWTARFISNNNLRQHCHLLARTFRGEHPQTDPIRAPCLRLLQAVAGQSKLLTQVHPSDFQLVPLMVRIAAYTQRWIRQPETWVNDSSKCPRKVIQSLLEHLFARWKMPACFDSAWYIKGDLTFLERDWYCHLAAGGSLRTIEGMPASITTRALHLALQAPENLTIRQALRWGQVKALGGSDELLAEVLSSRMVKDLSNDAVWSRLLEKVIARANFNPRNFGIISDTLLESFYEGKHGRAEALVNLPLRELLCHSKRYWENLVRLNQENIPTSRKVHISCANVRWDLHCLKMQPWASLPGTRPFEAPCFHQGETFQCRIQELTYPWQLVVESRAMKHCVDSYGKSCKLGVCSIFSMRSERIIEGKSVITSHLTIEVSRKTRRILQVRGRWNQYFHPSRIPILHKWARELRLTM